MLKKIGEIFCRLRDKRGGYRRLSERLRLYKEALKLHRSGLNNHRISRILGVGNSQIRDWLVRGVAPRYDRYNPDLSPSPELAYLIGFWLGDGREAGGQKKVRFKLADRGQLDYVNGLVAGLLGRKPKPILMDGPFYVVDYDTAILYDFLAQPIKLLWRCIWLFKRDFLRGFFDAEGYVSCSVDVSVARLGPPIVGVANTNLEYLQLIRRLLTGLGIQSSINTTNKKGGEMTIRGKTWIRKHDVRHLVVRGREQTLAFFKAVGFKNATKQEKLGDLVRLSKLSPGKRFDWFVRHYEKRGRRWYRISSLPQGTFWSRGQEPQVR